MKRSDKPDQVARPKAQRRHSWVQKQWDIDADYGRSKLRSRRIARFMEHRVTITSGRGYGKRMKLLGYQKERLLPAILDRPDDIQTIIVSGPRGFGKSGLAAGLAVALLYETPGADIVIASTGMRTARIPFDRAVKAVEADPDLLKHAIIHRNPANPYIELPDRNARLTPLPAEERYLVGQAPSAIIVDEIGFTSAETYRVLQTALGKVDDAFLFGTGTPGLGPVEQDGSPNIMYQLRELNAKGEAPSLRYVELSADPSDDPGDPVTWRKANPGLGKLVSENSVKNDWLTLPLQTFQLYRLGMWVQHEASYIKAPEWDALQTIKGLPPAGAVVTLGFDGSSSSDSTALVMMDMATHALYVMGHWQPPKGARQYRVPRQEVSDQVAYCFERWKVARMFCDPWLWRSEIQEWQETWGADVVEELDTSRMAKMGPATDAFRAAVEHRTIAWDTSEQLRSHAISAVARATPGGDILTKDARRPSRIDLLIAAVLAHEATRLTDVPQAPFIV